MGKKVIVIGGSGGREHALAWKLSLSQQVEKVYIAPGNGGTGEVGENVAIQPNETEKLVSFCKDNSVDLAVIGPDDLLASGLADQLRNAHVTAFGPSQKAAQIESSKAFAKDMMAAQNVPTAKYATFTDAKEAISYVREQPYPLVVKASGLALGKGVLICDDFSAAKKAVELIMLKKAFKSAGETIVIEEFLNGSEVSFHALSDGNNYTIFPASQDHKQIFDNDKGPNTGGMGAFGPVAWVTKQLQSEVEEKIIRPVFEGLRENRTPFSGCLYPGLMITADGPKTLEYNARFGDPETQTYMRLLDSDLFDLLYSCAQGILNPGSVKWKNGYAVSVVLASKGYPGNYEKGLEITGTEEVKNMEDIVLFHAGTKLIGRKLLTSGGRVLNVTAYAQTLEDAIKKAYRAVERIHFPGMQYRSDIGRRAKPDFI